MDFIIDQLGFNNPFGTQIGQLIEKATDTEQATEDWSLLLEICDIVNGTEDGPKDAMRAIRKRLQQGAGKNNKMLMFTLTVVETCVKNCGHRFHVLVATKDFMQDLVKLISPKNDPPAVLQERVLSLIQTWADAFATSPDLKEVSRVYQELKTKGVEFPMTDMDSMAPIHTPARSFPDAAGDTSQHHPPASSRPVAQPPQHPPQHPSHNAQQHASMNYRPASGPLNAEQMAKLRRDLDVVYQNCFVFNDMLTNIQPGEEKADDVTLLQQLNATCRQMQTRVMDLVQQVQNDDFTGELLRINDDLLNAFVRYDRFERQRQSQRGGATPLDGQVPTSTFENAATLPLHRNTPPPASSSTGNLIDFGGPSSNDRPNANGAHEVNAGVAGLSLSAEQRRGQNEGFDESFDMFAQSRQSFEQNQKQLDSSSSYRNQQEDTYTGGLGAALTAKSSGHEQQSKPPHSENEYDEMAKWMSQNPKPSDHATSSEFDAFLSQRAQSSQNGTTTTNQTTRQLRDDGHDNSLFSL